MLGVTDARKARQLAEREQRIIAAARALAEESGWESVTVRRLADAIEYSQPVLYSHFPHGRSQIVTAVALVGFDELATALSRAGSALGHDASGEDRVRAVVTTYLEFADRHPAVYEAMFRLPIAAPFASPDTPRALQDGFDAIVEALRRSIGHPQTSALPPKCSGDQCTASPPCSEQPASHRTTTNAASTNSSATSPC